MLLKCRLTQFCIDKCWFCKHFWISITANLYFDDGSLTIGIVFVFSFEPFKLKFGIVSFNHMPGYNAIVLNFTMGTCWKNIWKICCLLLKFLVSWLIYKLRFHQPSHW